MSFALVVSALALGFFGSTHCVVMCGGIVTALSGALVPLGRRPRATFGLTLAYNAGRVASYALGGMVAGGFGALASRLVLVRDGQLVLRVAMGLAIFAFGLHVAGLWPRLARIERVGAPLWRRIEPVARRLLPVQKPGQAFALGLLWGWMPCGLVYAALALAAGAGSWTGGALTMAAFGAGTLPALFALGTVAARIGGLARAPWMRRAAGVMLLAFGVIHVASASARMTQPDSTCQACRSGKHGG